MPSNKIKNVNTKELKNFEKALPSVFAASDTRKLVKAASKGDLEEYKKALNDYKWKFTRDYNMVLVLLSPIVAAAQAVVNHPTYQKSEEYKRLDDNARSALDDKIKDLEHRLNQVMAGDTLTEVFKLIGNGDGTQLKDKLNAFQKYRDLVTVLVNGTKYATLDNPLIERAGKISKWVVNKKYIGQRLLPYVSKLLGSKFGGALKEGVKEKPKGPENKGWVKAEPIVDQPKPTKEKITLANGREVVAVYNGKQSEVLQPIELLMFRLNDAGKAATYINSNAKNYKGIPPELIESVYRWSETLQNRPDILNLLAPQYRDTVGASVFLLKQVRDQNLVLNPEQRAFVERLDHDLSVRQVSGYVLKQIGDDKSAKQPAQPAKPEQPKEQPKAKPEDKPKEIEPKTDAGKASKAVFYWYGDEKNKGKPLYTFLADDKGELSGRLRSKSVDAEGNEFWDPYDADDRTLFDVIKEEFLKKYPANDTSVESAVSQKKILTQLKKICGGIPFDADLQGRLDEKSALIGAETEANDPRTEALGTYRGDNVHHSGEPLWTYYEKLGDKSPKNLAVSLYQKYKAAGKKQKAINEALGLINNLMTVAYGRLSDDVKWRDFPTDDVAELKQAVDRFKKKVKAKKKRTQ